MTEGTTGTTTGEDGNRNRQQARPGGLARSTRRQLEAVARAALRFRAAEARAAGDLDPSARAYADGHDGHDGRHLEEMVRRTLTPVREARAVLYRSLEALGAGDDD